MSSILRAAVPVAAVQAATYKYCANIAGGACALGCGSTYNMPSYTCIAYGSFSSMYWVPTDAKPFKIYDNQNCGSGAYWEFTPNCGFNGNHMTDPSICFDGCNMVTEQNSTEPATLASESEVEVAGSCAECLATGNDCYHPTWGAPCSLAGFAQRCEASSAGAQWCGSPSPAPSPKPSVCSLCPWAPPAGDEDCYVPSWGAQDPCTGSGSYAACMNLPAAVWCGGFSEEEVAEPASLELEPQAEMEATSVYTYYADKTCGNGQGCNHFTYQTGMTLASCEAWCDNYAGCTGVLFNHQGTCWPSYNMNPASFPFGQNNDDMYVKSVPTPASLELQPQAEMEATGNCATCQSTGYDCYIAAWEPTPCSLSGSYAACVGIAAGGQWCGSPVTTCKQCNALGGDCLHPGWGEPCSLSGSAARCATSGGNWCPFGDDVTLV